MKFKIIILLVGLSINVYAQNSLSGKITDKNQNPLFGVEIYAPKLHKGVTSEEDGTFNFQKLPNGNVDIVFAFIGYQSVIKSVNFDGKPIELNITLEESVFEMDEVIVSTPFNKLQSENVMKVEFKSIEQIQKTGAPTLIEGLTSIPGVAQISTGTNIGKPVIRGLSANRVLVYAQGIRLENQQFGDEHGLGINEAGIESAEVIKGPASLLYGSDALGGVLYLNSEKFVKYNSVESQWSNTYFSNTRGINSSFVLKSSGEKLKFLTRGTYNRHIDYEDANNKRVTNSRFQEYDFKTAVGIEVQNFSTELRYNYNLSRIGIPEEIGDQNTNISLAAPNQRIDNHVVSLHNHVYFRNSNLDINIGYTANNRKEFEEHHEEEEHEEESHEEEEEHEEEEAELALHMKLRTITYDAKYHLPKFGKLETIIGIQGLYQENTNFGEELLIPDAKVNDLGFFGTLAYSWDDHHIQGGLRYDNRDISTQRMEIEDHEHDEGEEDEDHEDEEPRFFEATNRAFNSFTASLGYKTTLFKAITTRINFASGYRAPNLAELTSNGVHHGTNRFEIGNANLNNEQNIQFDLALEYKNEHVEFFINGFYNNIQDYIFLRPTGQFEEGNLVFEYIQDNAKLYGGEAGFHFHPHPLDWLHVESSFELVIGKVDNGEYLPLIPANQWNNTIRMEFKETNWQKNGFVSVTLATTFEQNKVSQFETTTEGYSLLNFGLGGDFLIGSKAFNARLMVNNLMNKEYIAHLSRLKTDGILNPGRNIVVGLRFNI